MYGSAHFAEQRTADLYALSACVRAHLRAQVPLCVCVRVRPRSATPSALGSFASRRVASRVESSRFAAAAAAVVVVRRRRAVRLPCLVYLFCRTVRSASLVSAVVCSRCAVCMCVCMCAVERNLPPEQQEQQPRGRRRRRQTTVGCGGGCLVCGFYQHGSTQRSSSASVELCGGICICTHTHTQTNTTHRATYTFMTAVLV